jgi:hypothetical protein
MLVGADGVMKTGVISFEPLKDSLPPPQLVRRIREARMENEIQVIFILKIG